MNTLKTILVFPFQTLIFLLAVIMALPILLLIAITDFQLAKTQYYELKESLKKMNAEKEQDNGTTK